MTRGNWGESNVLLTGAPNIYLSIYIYLSIGIYLYIITRERLRK